MSRIALRRKYSESQPRVPAGNSDGGQWTSGGASSRLAQALPPLLRPLPFLAKPPIAPRPVIRPPAETWPTDPTKPPAPGFEWQGRPGSTPGDGTANFYNKQSKESLRPDFDNPKHGPHWDWHRRDGTEGYRWYPDGSVEPKPGILLSIDA